MSNIDKQALRTVAMLAKELSGISMYSKAIAAINKFHELFTPDVALALLDEMEAKDKEISKLRSVIQASRKYVDVLENQLNGRGDND
ncbi:ead/Ea22-like family protein [Citrobacter koseri]|uniref:ead/Ea22-like family protein n=1 Tax=Citrobacter koseri TaxID=545 RepID=UPI003524727C